MTTKQELGRLIREGLYVPQLSETVIHYVKTAVETHTPLLLDGQAGSGKTASVYYVALMNNIRVIEYNASDDLKKKEIVQLLQSQVIEAHDEEWIILLDEIDKKSNLKLLTEIIYSVKLHSENLTVIAITNFGWELNKYFDLGKIKTSFTGIFGANHKKVYRPYVNAITTVLKRKGVKILPSASISTDLRNFEKMVIARDFSCEEATNFENAFYRFQLFMGKRPNKRKELPTAKQLGGDISKWIIKNGFSSKSNLGIRWWQSNFQIALDVLSYAKMYENDDVLYFLPKYWLKGGKDGNFKHPNSL